MVLGKASRFAYLSGSAMALLSLLAIVVVATWPSPVGPRVVITIALALLLVAELAMLPVALRLYSNLPAAARPLGALGLLALAVSLAALLVLVWAYLAESTPPSP